jgi:hypothetical protein
MSGEVEQGLRIGLTPVRPAIPSELVVIDYGFNDGLSLAPGYGYFIGNELCPFIIGVGEFRAYITSKGVVVLTANYRDDKYLCHDRSCAQDVIAVNLPHIPYCAST